MKLLVSLLVLSIASRAMGGGVDDWGTGAAPKPRSESVGGWWCSNDADHVAVSNGGLDFTEPSTDTDKCASGLSQSPIALMTADASPAGTKLVPKFNWVPSQYWVEGTAHGPRMDLGLPSGAPYTQFTDYAGTQLTLLQWHAHAPSEHTLDGKYFDAEIHFVHKDLDSTSPTYNQIFVFGVFVEVTKKGSNSVFDALIRNSGELENGAFRGPGYADGVSPATVNPMDLLPEPRGRRNHQHRPYLQYTGSLTTQPCSQGVHWHVFVDPIQISAMAWREYLHLVAKTDEAPRGYSFWQNNRATQALNGRDVYKQDF